MQNQLVRHDSNNAKDVCLIPVLTAIHLRVGLSAPSNSEYSVHVLLFIHFKRKWTVHWIMGVLTPA